MTDGSAKPAMQTARTHRAAPLGLRRRRNPNAPVMGSRSFVRWYERLGSGVALLLIVVFTGLMAAALLVIFIGLAMVFLGNAIGAG